MSTEPPLPRDDFPVGEEAVYLNHATICAPPLSVTRAAAAFAADAGRRGGLGFMDRVASVRPVRSAVSQLLGASEHGVAFAANTTTALARIVDGLDWSPGDRALVATHDFPSTRLPVLALRHRGVSVDEAISDPSVGGVSLDQWRHALQEAPTRLVVTTWVHSNRGHRTDLAALAEVCHDHGALLVADVIQGLGVVPAEIEAWGVDAAVGGSHKWVLGLEGIGFSWTSDGLTDALVARADGWRWMGTDATSAAYDRPPDSTALRLEAGTLNGAGLAALGAGIDLLLTAGVEAVWAYVCELNDRLVEGIERWGGRVLSDHDTASRSAITCFDHAHIDAASLVTALDAAGVAVTERDRAVRVSPHGWNTADDIDALLAAAAGVAG